MSREIKFRAWDKTENKMYNDYTWVNGFGELCPKIFKHTPDYSPQLIIEQYTGLKDKNGREIYEGDIMAVDDSDSTVLGVCTYRDGAFIVKDGIIACTLKGTNEYSKVIGNIHENKNLL